MFRPVTRSLLILALGLSLIATGLVSASARGQVRAGGEVLVLCSGAGLVQVTLDESGEPTGATHLCPDLALSLVAALDLPAAEVERPAVPVEIVPPGMGATIVTADVPTSRARGPPVVA